MKKNMGIHHITSIVGHPQENMNFYKRILGLRLIKKTVNFDDPTMYHLYFGDERGNPGTAITFFPQPNGIAGKIGDGQVGVTSYAVPKGALGFWEDRFNKKNIAFNRGRRFGEEYLELEDPHGLKIEIVERHKGKENHWEYDDITPDVAIKGFGGAVLYSSAPEETSKVLEKVMGLEKIKEDEEYIRFESLADIGNIIDLYKTSKGRGVNGVGVVHHLSWRAEDDKDQLEWKEIAESYGYRVTEVRDRNYFKSIYFRDEGGILFEIATGGPGFSIDEELEALGEKLMLPSQYEGRREEIEEKLIPINLED